MVRTWIHEVQDLLHKMGPFTTSSKDQIQILRRELQFLKIFFWCFVNWPDATENDSSSATKVQEASASLEDAVIDIICSIELEIEKWEDSEIEEIENWDDQNTENLNLLVAKFLEKVEYYRPVLKEAFLDLSDLSLECKYSYKEDIRELVDFAIKNLKNLVVLKPAMLASVKMQIGAVEKRLEFVSAIFHFASRDQHVDVLNCFFNHLKNWANSAAGVPFLYWVDEIDERVNTYVSRLIQKFKPCTLQLGESYLGALKALKPFEESDFALQRIAVARFLDILLEDLFLVIGDGFEMIQEGLIVCISFLINPAHEHAVKGKLISTHSNLCVNEAVFLICSLYGSNLREDITMGRNIVLHALVEKMNRAKAEIRELSLEIPASSWNNLPRPNVQGFLDSFLEDINEKLKCETALTTYEKHQIVVVQKELLSFKPLLMGLLERQDENEELKDLWTRIVRVAYCVDYVIDSCFFFDATNWCNILRLSNVIEKIQFTKTELISKSREILTCSMRIHGDQMTSSGVLLEQANKTIIEDVVVGFTDEAEEIIDGLTRGSTQLDIVAIVGMPGQGKTTLAKKVYHDRRVRLHFKKYAWCCISQAYKIKQILITILKDVNSPVPEDQISDKSHVDLAEQLYRCLKGRAYLIVLDDIWDVGAWNELKESFPEDNNGSRIIFTSRIRRVALEAKPDCSLHKLYPLSFEDSWKLLQLKLSYEDGWPLHLLDIGKQIAENCKGLPLAIVVTAGLLAKTDGDPDFWKQIAQGTVSSQIAREGCMDILELSYKHLPDYLKSCFLYLGVVPEDFALHAKMLTLLWVAEGFVRKHEMKSLEDVAYEYLMDLVDRSLLFVIRSSRGKIKWCVVHDLVREFCLEKAKDENFLRLPNISDDHSFNTMHECYRLCIRSKCWPFFESEPTAPTVRTLLFFGPAEDADSPFFFIWFKFLRVLHLEGVKIDCDIDGITQLVHLRFLSLRGKMNVPSSIVKLSRLEVFYLHSSVDSSFLPKSMWRMRNLRHLYVPGRPFEDMEDDDDMVEESLQLDNLQTFTYFHFRFKEHFICTLRRIPNVRKLGVKLEFCFQLSGFLSKLESLDLSIRRKLSPSEFDLPLTLSRLVLEDPTLSASMISAIGKLPKLEVLKLFCVKFEDDRWDVEDDEFLNLKCLELRDSDIKQWKVSDDSFPQLQQLHLNDCNKLRQISSRFGELPTLTVIKVSRCRSQSIEDSVNEIIAEQENCGNVDLEFVFSPEGDSSDEE